MSHNDDMEFEEDDSSDEMEPENYYKLTTLPPPKYPAAYASRKTESKNDTSIGLPLRKSIMVGSSYQATIPELIKKPPYSDKKKPYWGEDKLLWNPYKLSSQEVEQYLGTVQKMKAQCTHGVAAIPRGAHTTDNEQALFTLLQCGYSVDKALPKFKANTQPKDTSAHWSEEECKNFESGVRIYGKEFFLIRANKLRSRTVGELVQFYYLWKKTERHDVFANRVKLEKKKYSLHPGVTFLEDHDESSSLKDGTFTNIQCLIYGDIKKFHRGTDLTNHTSYYDNVIVENTSSKNKQWTNPVNSANLQT